MQWFPGGLAIGEHLPLDAAPGRRRRSGSSYPLPGFLRETGISANGIRLGGVGQQYGVEIGVATARLVPPPRGSGRAAGTGGVGRLFP
jgi:hypothetical protein